MKGSPPGRGKAKPVPHGGAEPALSEAQVTAIAPLIGIGGKSGDTVAGLSAVRRQRRLAFVFVGAGVSANTVGELRRRERQGTRLLQVADMDRLTGPLGRIDVTVLGVREGSLAAGIEKKLASAK